MQRIREKVLLIIIRDFLLNSLQIIFISKMDNPEQYFMINKGSLVQFKNQSILKYYDFDEKEIGRGAYGVVFKAKEKGVEGNQYRAVKAIPKKMIKSMVTLMNQIENLAMLDHPGIIKLYETYEDKKSVFIVTDLCEGGELFDYLERKGTFGETDARDIFIQIIQVLKYYNSKNIAHRDLKPQNFVFLNKKSLNLKLIDFGLSFKWNNDMRQELKQKKQNTLVGTPYYIAPEVIDGSYDQRCDIWSAGVILYIMITGLPPFGGRSTQQILASIRRGVVRVHIPEFKNVTPQCKDLILKLLQPENRRIKIEQIFQHPWIKLKVPRYPLKINFENMIEFVRFSKLKKITAAFIAFRLSEQQVETLLNLFKQIDTNNDGYVSVQELYQTLFNQSEIKTFHQLSEIIHKINTKKDNRINYTQFLASNLDQTFMLKRSNLLRVFKIIDLNGNGTVQRNELQEALVKNKMINLSVNGQQVDQIMDACDKNKDGKIDFEEFVSYLTQEEN